MKFQKKSCYICGILLAGWWHEGKVKQNRKLGVRIIGHVTTLIILIDAVSNYMFYAVVLQGHILQEVEKFDAKKIQLNERPNSRLRYKL